jgi:hypothetical protein
VAAESEVTDGYLIAMTECPAHTAGWRSTLVDLHDFGNRRVPDDIPHRENRMRLLRRINVPASESQMAVVLSASVVMLAMLLCALMWQSNVIVYQRDVIRDLWSFATQR